MTQDLVAALVEVPTPRGKQEVVIASAYFPGDTAKPPPIEVTQLLEFCKQKKKQCIIGCDANAHHTIWGSSDINKRGEHLLEFLIKHDLEFINRGKEPTFRNVIRQEILDLTLASASLAERIVNWHVSREESMSDHRHIRFDIESSKVRRVETRVPKLTDWCSYREHIRMKLMELDEDPIESREDLDRISTKLKEIIISSYLASCPVKSREAKREVPWWNRELEGLRAKARKLYNKAKRKGKNQELRKAEYRKALTEYNKELRKSRRRTWRGFCEEVDDQPTAARLQKVLSKDHSNPIGLLQKPDGSYTGSREETVKVLLQTHFPDSRIVEDGEETLDVIEADHRPTKRTKSLSSKIFTPRKIRWAISSFKPYKSPGGDGVFPALLQQGLEELTPFLTKVFRASYALSYIPIVWRDVNVVFIPKGGGRSTAQPKSFRPISLTSFMLKSMEKVLDYHIRKGTLHRIPLHPHQHAYQEGKSTITALHHLVVKLEKAMAEKETALCAFLDIEGAFDNTSFEVIERAANKKGLEIPTIKWIKSMLSSRRITAKLGDEAITVIATRGCPQGGVLSPLLWSLVVDELLQVLTEAGYENQGYADDLVIIVKGKDDQQISNDMQNALDIVKSWSQEVGLRVNPEKTTIVPFTKRRKLKLNSPTLGDTIVGFSKEVKYLGVILDKQLTWNPHLNRVTEKATTALWTCKRFFGKTWGLKPKMTLWSYSAIIKPMVTYAAMIWWPKAEQKTGESKLRTLQRLACLGVTGAMRTCPTAALEALLDLLPLHLCVKREAALSAIRLQRANLLMPEYMAGHLKILDEFKEITESNALLDFMPTQHNFDLPFRVILPDRQEWLRGERSFERGSLVWYTDGSRMEGRTGIGVYGPNFRVSKALGTAPTIFQAEIHAIELCAHVNNKRETRGANIYILSDSQAALKALSSFTCSSKLVWDCLNALKQLAKNNRVTLMWVPGHEGIEGNEIADQLAKKGAESTFIGPEPFCGYSKSHLQASLKNWEARVKATYWNNQSGLRQAKKFITFSQQKTKSLLALNRIELKAITGLLSGHCPLKYHLKKMGFVEDETCRFCMEEEETAEHVLCQCEALSRLRLKHLRKAFLLPTEVAHLTPKEIAGFIKVLDL